MHEFDCQAEERYVAHNLNRPLPHCGSAVIPVTFARAVDQLLSEFVRVLGTIAIKDNRGHYVHKFAAESIRTRVRLVYIRDQDSPSLVGTRAGSVAEATARA